MITFTIATFLTILFVLFIAGYALGVWATLNYSNDPKKK